MNWFEPIDAYCERTSAAFWAEPVNALSNLAFLAAAGIAFQLWRRRGGQDRVAVSLIGLVAVIGVGSFLFHTFADQWSVLADVIPIAIFIYAYFALALRRLLGLRPVVAGAGTLAFIAGSYGLAPLAEPLVGSSASYVPALLALLGIGSALALRRRREAGTVLAAGLVFSLSLTLRTLDGPICERLPLGTHFLWHVLNAVTLGLLLVAAIRAGPAAKRRGEKVSRPD